MRIEDALNGVISAKFELSHLEERGLTLQSFFLNPNNVVDLAVEVIDSLNYATENEILTKCLLVSTDVVSNGVNLYIYLPHDISKRPYILDGEEYTLPPKPIGFMLVEDEDFLGGLCECPVCEMARTNYHYHGVAPFNSNAPEADVDPMDMSDAPFEYTIIDVSEEDDEDGLYLSSGVDASGIQVIAPNDLVFRFRDIEQVIAVAKRFVDVYSDYVNLYQYEKNYYLVFQETADDKDLVGDISAVNIEHGGIRSGRTDVFLAEYGKLIIEDEALVVLTKYF